MSDSAPPARILYVQHAADLYGASRALLHLLAALDRSRFTPLVVVPTAGPLLDSLCALDIEPLILPSIQTLWGSVVRSWRVVPFALGLLPSALAMRALIRREKANLVHSNVWTVLSGASGARLAGVPHIWHAREILPIIGGLKPLLARYTLRSSARVVCISEAVAAQFVGLPGAERVRVIYDGLPLANAPEQSRVDSSNLTIGVVGRLHPQKGQAELLRAYSLLEPRLRARSRLVFAGGTSPGHEAYADELQALARSLDVAERAEFLGFVPHARRLIGQFDILALPATRPEGLGGVLLEAMAACVPVLATRAGGAAEVVEDGVNGLIVAPGDVRGLADALARLLGDAGLRERLGAAGRQTVEARFTAQRMAEQTMALYEEAGIRKQESGVRSRR